MWLGVCQTDRALWVLVYDTWDTLHTWVILSGRARFKLTGPYTHTLNFVTREMLHLQMVQQQLIALRDMDGNYLGTEIL